MGRIIGLLLFVVCIWVGLEIYNEGIGGAFGGALASLGGSEASRPADNRSVPQRAGAAVERANAVAAERREKLLGE